MSYERPVVTEIPQELEPVEPDPFIKDLGRIVLEETEEKELDTTP